MASAATHSPAFPKVRPRVAVLGNCVAHRLQLLLPEYPGFADAWDMVPTPMIHTLRDQPEGLAALARQALACDVILTQPLLRFGPCNTASLAAALRPGQRLVTFSSPNFEAYFPDVFTLSGRTGLTFEPIFDWDSRIIFSCFLAKVPIFEVEQIYLGHALFQEKAARAAVERSLEVYARHDQDVDLPTLPFIARNYARVKLFHTWKHPAEALMAYMLDNAAAALGLPRAEMSSTVAKHSFGFNQWPVLTGHGLFSFPGQEWFIVAGQRQTLEDVAMAYYNFYEFHPHIVERNQEAAIPL